MSQENVEIVRRACRVRWNRGDLGAASDVDARVHDGPRVGPARESRGREAVDQGWQGLVGALAPWEDDAAWYQRRATCSTRASRCVVAMIRVLRGQAHRVSVERGHAGASCHGVEDGRIVDHRRLLRPRRKPSKPWACRSKTLTPTPEPARYCAGDVAGERGEGPSFRGDVGWGDASSRVSALSAHLLDGDRRRALRSRRRL